MVAGGGSLPCPGATTLPPRALLPGRAELQLGTGAALVAKAAEQPGGREPNLSRGELAEPVTCKEYLQVRTEGGGRSRGP